MLSNSILFSFDAIKEAGKEFPREYTFSQWHKIYSTKFMMVVDQGIGPLEALQIVMYFYRAHEKIVERCFGLE